MKQFYLLLLTLLSFSGVQAAPDYYLVYGEQDWTKSVESYKFTKSDESTRYYIKHTYKYEGDFPAGQFSILKISGNTYNWLYQVEADDTAFVPVNNESSPYPVKFYPYGKETPSITSNILKTEKVIRNPVFTLEEKGSPDGPSTFTLTISGEEVDPDPGYDDTVPEGKGRVYFLDRDGSCKAGLQVREAASVSAGLYASTPEFEAIPIEAVILPASHPLYSFIGEEGLRIYCADIPADTSSWISFCGNASADAQAAPLTGDLWPVAGGVYSKKDITLPSGYYVPAETGTPELLPYPNALRDTPSRFVFVDVPEFTAHAAKGSVSFEVIRDEDGEKTVIAGTGSGIRALRVTYPQPGGTGRSLLSLCIPEICLPGPEVPLTLRVFETDGTDAPLELAGVRLADGDVYSRQGIEKETLADVVGTPGVDLIAANKVSGFIAPDKRKPINICSAGIAAPVPNGEVHEDRVGQNAPGVHDGHRGYVVAHVGGDSEFLLRSGLTVSGETSTLYYGPGEEGMVLRPGVCHPLLASSVPQEVGFFLIEPQEEAVSHPGFNVVLDYLNLTIYTEMSLPTPGFAVNPGENSLPGNDGFLVEAVADDRDAGEGLGWTIDGESGQQVQPSTQLSVRHTQEYGGTETERKGDHYEQTAVNIRPAADYAEYFEPGRGNHSAAITSPLSFGASEVSTFGVKAFTAGEYEVEIVHPNLTTGEAPDLRASRTWLRLRVTPTVQSVGLALNGTLVIPEREGGAFNPAGATLAALILPEGTEERDIYTTTDGNGKTIEWPTSRRVCMQSFMADPRNVEVYWKYVDSGDPVPAPHNVARGSVAKRAGSSAAVSDYDLEDGMEPYTIVHTLRDADIAAHQRAGDTHALVRFQIRQNGILGAPQNVRIYTASNPNIPTGATLPSDSIDAQEMADSVYYTLDGHRAVSAQLPPGFYIEVRGHQSRKILVR